MKHINTHYLIAAILLLRARSTAAQAEDQSDGSKSTTTTTTTTRTGNVTNIYVDESNDPSKLRVSLKGRFFLCCM